MKKFLALAIAVAIIVAMSACAAPTPAPAASSEAPAASSEAPAASSQAPAASSEAPAASSEAPAASTIPTFESNKVPSGKVIKIGYSAQNEKDEWNKFMSDALAAEAAKYGAAVQLVKLDAQAIAATQVSQVEDLITQGMDVIIINAYDKDAITPALEAVVAAKIPLVTLNTVPTANNLANSYVGVDDKEAGILETDLLCKALGGKGTINILQGEPGHPAAENRQLGIDEALKKYPDIKVGSAQTGMWNKEKALKLMEDWLAAGTQIDGVICHNDEMAVAAMNAIDAAKKDIKVVGIDAIEDALEAVKAGTMLGTVFQDAAAEGEGAVNVAVALVLGTSVQKEYMIPFEVVTKDNADKFLNK